MTPRAQIERAERALAGARVLLSHADYEGACSRASYAMFHAAQGGGLPAAGTDASATKTHRGLIAAFGQHLVRPGIVEAELGRSLNRVEAIRLTADYLGEAPSEEDAAWALGEAETFIRAIRTAFALP